MNKFLVKIFFFAILISLVIQPVAAQEKENTPTPTPTPTFVKYDLAYPGMLPDNPLYGLKVFRDKISISLMSDPQKKVDFYLLKTDKGILAAAMLVDKKKIELAKETALKAEHNFTLLTYQLNSLGKKPNEGFFEKLRTASLKHQEVLNSLIKRVSPNDAKTFQTVINFSKTNWQTVEEYRKPHDFPQ